MSIVKNSHFSCDSEKIIFKLIPGSEQVHKVLTGSRRHVRMIQPSHCNYVYVYVVVPRFTFLSLCPSKHVYNSCDALH